MCFIKCNKYYTEEFLTFIQTEQRRSNVMTPARIQPFCRKFFINIEYFGGARINLRNITQRNTALKLQNIGFCLIWKSNNISFNQVIEDGSKQISKLLITLYLIDMLKVFLNTIKNLKSPVFIN